MYVSKDVNVLPRQDLSKMKGELVNLLAMADEYNSLLAQVGHICHTWWNWSIYWPQQRDTTLPASIGRIYHTGCSWPLLMNATLSKHR
jgi:hypothetical protein